MCRMSKPIIECDNCFKQYKPAETCYEYTTQTGETYTLCVECDALPDADDVLNRGESVLGVFAKKLAEVVPSYTNT
jgi:hypothetical protein